MKNVKIALFALATVCASASFAADKECETNTTVDGTLLAGRTYKTHAFVAEIAPAAVMKKVSQNLASTGWQITTADSNLGIITATTGANHSNGKTSPLSVAIEEKNGGVNLSISFVTLGGVKAKTEDVTKQFCAIVDAASSK